MSGREVVGPNGNSLFLPAAGHRDGSFLDYSGSEGYFWSRTLHASYPSLAYYLYFKSGSVSWYGSSRYYGHSVRPVRAIDVQRATVTGISLSHSSLSLSLGGSQALTATVLPSDATDKSVTWSSSNTAVATVTASGLVTAVADGSCTITCTAQDGSGVTATCLVTVVGGGPDSHAYVDLGLPSGTLWATTNIGAEKPEDYARYRRCPPGRPCRG